jgi:prepilin-type N-terminal cleavage/methylation domain-containing protein
LYANRLPIYSSGDGPAAIVGALVFDERRHDRGFTFVETMTVVAILGSLVLIAMSSYSVSIAQAQRVACVHNQRVIQDAAIQYAVANGSRYPAVLSDLGAYVQRLPELDTCTSPPFNRLVYDADTGSVSCSTPGHQQ